MEEITVIKLTFLPNMNVFSRNLQIYTHTRLFFSLQRCEHNPHLLKVPDFPSHVCVLSNIPVLTQRVVLSRFAHMNAQLLTQLQTFLKFWHHRREPHTCTQTPPVCTHALLPGGTPCRHAQPLVSVSSTWGYASAVNMLKLLSYMQVNMQLFINLDVTTFYCI